MACKHLPCTHQKTNISTVDTAVKSVVKMHDLLKKIIIINTDFCWISLLEVLPLKSTRRISCSICLYWQIQYRKETTDTRQCCRTTFRQAKQLLRIPLGLVTGRFIGKQGNKPKSYVFHLKRPSLHSQTLTNSNWGWTSVV